ncbi:putative mediator of RNA polymerase II transcription subunit 12 [Drosophila subpulchrella]|uniref:putative mediator of RNA polymerase II transcription subunit 12 n=1 Tax=Drosophila subpulchrella TaxID=1486046 RepID=UPI0018A1AEB3|nr:putative mediator of RNA polymerase II transcription subunit 12 [Drosophila subpulchrella]XP_037714573.1 putative mediator of RNA polymerase II transcription subunit 12 [Drosophila subpulchrella]
MRTLPFLLALALLVIGATATASSSSSSTSTTTSAKPKTEAKPKAEPEKPTKQPSPSASPASKATTSTSTTHQSKTVKPGENRGKRTLYDFGNAGYLYPEIASRRAGYVDNTASYYPQTGYYNGQNAIAQYPNFGPAYAQYPQYLEAPEPIIEIIIKDANETLPEEPAQPIVTKKKKKKEKVHVFYVNYKKDQNNKLHLESPIASLNNDDNEEEEEEEEEVIQYPVTPLPPVKSTTLRTIIHPDSEKFHSNSGIHVSFGAENLHQTGHILEEHDAESVQRQVVALPPSVSSKSEGGYLSNTRADYGRENNFGRAPGPISNLLFGSNYQQSPINYQQQQQQQLPTQHGSNYFRPPAALVGPPPSYPKPAPQQQVQQQHRPSITQQQLPSTSSQTIFNKLVQQSQYYINHNQQYPQQQQQHHQQHQQQQPHHQQHQQQPQQHQHQQQQQHQQAPQQHLQQAPQQHQQQSPQQQQYQKPPHKQVQVPFFPTIPPKSVTPAPYQPVKFRPTPAPVSQVKPLPLPVKLDNTNYQQQQHYQPQQQQKLPHQQQSYQFIRQPQFVQQPQFVVRSPTPLPEYYSQQKQQTQQQHSQQQHHQSALNYFDIKPSKETELLKSIPKFEQHITETVHNPIVPSQQPQVQYQQQVQQQHQQGQQQHQQFAYSSTRNEVIHDVPAPNLGPTAQQPISGHYVTAGSSSAQHSQQQYHFPSEAPPQPPVYAESTHGQKVMVVTPVPPSSNYVTYSQYNQAAHEPVVHVNAQSASLQAQASTNFAQQPRQPASSLISAPSTDNSPFSVSTFHSDVFKELEQRNQNDKPVPHQVQQQAPKIPAAPVPVPQPAPVPAPTSPPASASPNGKASQTLLQLPDEVPDDLRQQLFSSGILNNADISILDYDKQGDIALENLPAEHLQHFYGNGGGAQIAETNKVLTVVKPNGDKVALSEKQLDRVKQSNSLPQKQDLDVKVVRYDAAQGQSVSDKYVRTDATVVTPVDLAERQQYNRYLPLKINGAQFPIPDSEELLGKRIVSVVVLAPVEAQNPGHGSSEARSASADGKEVKFLGGELIKTLVKKPTKENFKRWLEKEARTDLELQSVVLLVAKSTDASAEQEIFMYDIGTGSINRLNGELSSTFVNVAEENASSEDLEHAATLDPSSLESMMHLRRR